MHAKILPLPSENSPQHKCYNIRFITAVPLTHRISSCYSLFFPPIIKLQLKQFQEQIVYFAYRFPSTNKRSQGRNSGQELKAETMQEGRLKYCLLTFLYSSDPTGPRTLLNELGYPTSNIIIKKTQEQFRNQSYGDSVSTEN